MKIRIRLTLWFFSTSLIILLLFSLGTYLAMQRVMFQAMDKELDVVASAIERSYDPFFDHFEELDIFHENMNRFLEYYLMVYNKNEQPVYASPLTKIISLNIPLKPESEETGYTVETKVPDRISFLNSSPEGETTFRVISRPLLFRNQRIGWITIGLSIGHIERSMENLLEVIIGSIFFSILLLAGGSFFLTRKALDPVNTITQKANQISQNNLDQRITVAVEKDELGQLAGVLNNLLDRLQRAFVSQQQFLADAAHELKTPLSVLRSHWESELNNPGLENTIKEKLVQDIETLTRLNHLISNLLLLAQTEEIRTKFEFKPVRLDELLNDVLGDAGILADMKSQHIEVIELQPVTILGDRIRLFQLFFNIIDNAITYTQESGSVWVSLREEGGSAVSEIRDNGPGIAMEHLPHIFNRFYRVQKDRARKTGGSGLGLSICKLIAESHGGGIEVTSKTGTGTTFRIKLPASGQDLS